MGVSRAIVVATHNVMNGLRLGRLLRHYRRLRDTTGLHVLCVQENRCARRGGHGVEIARALGPRYAHIADPDRADVGIVFDRDRFRCREHATFALPGPARLSWLERRYSGPAPRAHHAQLAVLEDARGAPHTVANFHLSTAGGTSQRYAQMKLVVDRIRDAGVPERTVACGDTNAFHWRRRAQPFVLDSLLSPLASIGVRAFDDPRPTHHFARQGEPKFPHRLAACLGKLGLDLPLRYDVVCTNLRVTRCGRARTPESDHDLVWAAVAA